MSRKLTIFDKAYLWFKNIKTPGWLRDIFAELQLFIMALLSEFTKMEVDFIQKTIMNESNKDIPGKEKFDNVFNAFRERYDESTIKDRVLNMGIEIFFNYLKNKGLVK